MSVRWRLTLLYTGLFVLTGAVLLAINYSLVAAQLPRSAQVVDTSPTPGTTPGTAPSTRPSATPRATPVKGRLQVPVDTGTATFVILGATGMGGHGTHAQFRTVRVHPQHPGRTGGSRRPTVVAGPVATRTALTAFAGQVSDDSAAAYRDEALTQLVRKSLLALGFTTLLAFLLGLVVSRRVVRPLRDVIDAVRGLEAGRLDERLVVRGPRDELRELGETFNAMLDRLQASFRRERRLMLNISHELRTPLGNQRAVLEVGLDDPDADSGALRTLGETALAENLRTERLIERLLLLGSAEEGSPTLEERVDLSGLVHDVVAATDTGDLTDRTVDGDLGEVPDVVGDEVLLERLVANLVENAVRHNEPGGWFRVRTGHGPSADGRSGVWLEVSNSGPVVAADDVGSLFEPFRRQRGDRVESRRGVGLGLAIVSAIVARHDGTVRADPQVGGGLVVRVELPAA